MKTKFKLSSLHPVAVAAVLALVLLAPRPVKASDPVFTFTNLNSFYLSPDGANPTTALAQAANGKFYGTTGSGGADGNGVVFEISSNGALAVLHSFTGGGDGGSPQAGLALGANGSFYGTTSAGGSGGSGTVFEITTNGILTALYSFSRTKTGPYGLSPQAGLALGSDGNFYGTTDFGGTNNYGTVFKFATNGTLTFLYSFTNGTDGANPVTALIQGKDGYLYGTTAGGASEAGTAFKITTNGILTSLHVFGGEGDGLAPFGALVQNSATGILYGTTFAGGTRDLGTIYDITTNGTLTILYSFTGETDGAYPEAGLVMGSGGSLLGTAVFGGGILDGYGSVFSFIPGGSTLTTIYEFTGQTDGALPSAPLVRGSDGNYYGTASSGGNNGTTFDGNAGSGTVFKIIEPSGTFEPLYDFPQTNYVSAATALIHGSDGNFYGTSADGGTNSVGSIFEVTTNGAITSLYSFSDFNDGGFPVSPLVEGNDGSFYGTASGGGYYGNGTIFNVTPAGVLTPLYQFTGGADGGLPYGALVEGGDGYFYGATPGLTGQGTIFRVSTNGDLTTLYTFTNGIDGSATGGLTIGDDGNFYGTSYDGGTNEMGAFFVMDSSGDLTVLYSFTGEEDGGSPGALLALGGDGNFYGSTSFGGDYGFGTIFQMTPDGSWTTLYSFQGDYDGSNPSALLAGTDGNFYGTTTSGGLVYAGSIFEMTADGALKQLYGFTGGDDGGDPTGALVQGSDGSLYGTTTYGAAGGDGGVFRLSGSTLPSPLPRITSQPVNATMTLTGLYAEFSVEAVGGQPLTYQWRQNSVPLPSGGDFSDTDLATLNIDPAAPSDAGTYSVVVANSYGSVTSSNAVLSLLPDTNAFEDFEAGTNFLSGGDYVLANFSFSNALSFSPANPAYHFFHAASELLSLLQEPAGSNFLTRIGIGAEGRELFNWQAEEPTNADGHLEVPVTSPPLNADEFTAQLRTNVLPAVVVAEGDLAAITATNFEVPLTSSETHAGAVTVDWGDIQMLQSMGYAGNLLIYTLNSWNLDAQLNTATNIFANEGGFQGILAAYPGLLTTTSTSDLPAAKTAFINAIDSYFAASQFIRARPPGEIRLFNLDPAKAVTEFEFRQTLSNVLASLNGPVPLTIKPAYSVSAQAFFGGGVSPRSFLPDFQGNDFVWDTFPDTNLGGVFLGLTETDLGKFLIKRTPADLGTPGTSLSVLYDFTNFYDQTGLVQTPDGTLYGTMMTGGPFTTNDILEGVGYGTVFKITPSGEFNTLYAFGSVPFAVTNYYGGNKNSGYYVNDFPSDGAYPNALVLGKDGNLYGTTQSGGLSYNTNAGIVITNLTSGTVFKITTNGLLTTLHDFDSATDDFASAPAAALVQGADGRFYGTTEFSAETDTAGTIFAVSPTGVFSLLNAFPYDTNDYAYALGGYPAAPLLADSDGNLYGTTAFGGVTGIYTNLGKGGVTYTNVVYGYGTIFKVTTTGQMTLLYTFGTQQDADGDPLDGAVPNGLTQGADGVLYGMTEYGGANDNQIGLFGFVYPGFGAGDGTLFSISPSTADSFTTLVSFDENFPDGFNPIGSLAAGPSGTFCGVASVGGGDRKGAVFIFNTDDTATNIVWLNKTSGDYAGNLQSFVFLDSYFLGSFNLNPVPSLLTAGTDGNFYGTTTDGGTNGDGTVYVMNLGAEFGAPAIQSATLNDASISITWSTTPDSNYQVQFRSSMAGGAWSNVGPEKNATGMTLSATVSTAGTQGFYRIVLVR